MQNNLHRLNILKYLRPRPVKDLTADQQTSYRCVTGQHLLQFPAQMLNCGHRICLICQKELIGSILKDTEVGKIINCPGDDEECKETSIEFISPDYGINRELKRLPVYCINETYGCTEQMQWQLLENHLKNCDFFPVECPNKAFGCYDIVGKQNVTSHFSECRFSPIKCPHCELQISREEMEAGHGTECESKPKPCHFEWCEFKGLKPQVLSHMHEDHANHMSIVCEQLKLHKENQHVTKSEIEALVKEFSSIMKGISTEKHSFEACFSKLHDKLGMLEKFNQKSSMKLQSIECVSVEFDKINAIQKLFLAHEKTISQLENGQVATTNSSSQEVISKILSIQQALTNQERRLAEDDLRFQCIETANYDGELMWKIGDYRRRKMEAVSGRTTSLYSQPFYTSKWGYKMCARVFLNGDGLGKGSHLSLFFVVMKGDFDALQRWPFNYKVTFKIFDLKGNKHITDTFRPDITSTSFKRPVTEMNIASGCPLFVEQSELESGNNYIQDDTIFIRIKVHMDS